MIDILEKRFDLLSEDGSLSMNECFMMGIFDELKKKLPPF